MAKAKTLSVKVADNLTGIKSYRAAIDGKWILMEYEPKKQLLFYEFSSFASTLKGENIQSHFRDLEQTASHTFELTVTDGKNNIRTYKAEFVVR